MKKSILIALITVFLAGFSAQSQQTVRIAYVDMEYILQNVPEYQEASAQLDSKVEKWKEEIARELQKLEQMRTSLENEKPLLTNELIEERLEEISFEEKKLRDYQQQRFGPNGDLMTQKLQLVQPIQDQVFIAVQEIAANRDYDLIFDKSADVVMLYAAERLDISDQVLRSINRASNREQVSSRDEKEELLREEAKTVEESAAVSEREMLQETRKNEREALIEQRRKERDSIKEAKKQAYEARRAKLLEERQRKKDSIAKARENRKND
ncbi:MAG TPA: OmpH family outer membrane protein [Salinimicrobium sp.]|nr:OmpH family outer membrane protein [Salinimicrobium sp.]